MPPRSPIPKPGVTHGLGPTGKPSGYAQGCGCPECTAANTSYKAQLRASRRAEAGPPVRLAKDEARSVTVTVLLSGRVKALAERQAAREGVSLFQWIRDPVLKVLAERAGYADSVPDRPFQARREGISSDGGDGTGLGDAWNIPVNVRFTTIEKDLVRKLAAQDGMPAGQWVRELALARLEDSAGWEDTARRKAPRRPSRPSQEQEK